jgi:predicted PurR-regulated permease PerM
VQIAQLHIKGRTFAMPERYNSSALTLVAVVVCLAAATVARTVIAPLAAALLIVALIWPVQARLERYLPNYLALFLSVVVIIASFAAFGSLTAWAFGRVTRWVVAEAGRFQSVYEQIATWLESHGIAIAGVWTAHFDARWILRTLQSITSRLNTTLSFWLIVFVYVVLLLLEIRDFERKAKNLANQRLGHLLVQGTEQSASRLRRYMAVRTQMSLVTGVLVCIFAHVIGLQFATEWGVIAFVLNFIPFIGPFFATTFPTLFAATQFETWYPVLGLFVGLNLVQFIVGSYIEPRVAGAALSISPSLILLSVFLWASLWGPFGAFIGVPISIVALTFCALHPSSRWIAELLGTAQPNRPLTQPMP